MTLTNKLILLALALIVIGMFFLNQKINRCNQLAKEIQAAIVVSEINEIEKQCENLKID